MKKPKTEMSSSEVDSKASLPDISPRIFSKSSLKSGSSSQNLLILSSNLAGSWPTKVLEQERKHLDKLEAILVNERLKADARMKKLAELESRDESKIEAVKDRVKQKETEVKERNRLREVRAKINEERGRQDRSVGYDQRQKEIQEKERIKEEERVRCIREKEELLIKKKREIEGKREQFAKELEE